jgi:hypothetical protein
MADTPIDVKGNIDGITVSLTTAAGEAARELKADPGSKPLQVVVTTVESNLTLPLRGKGWTIKIEEAPEPAQPVPNP